MDLAEALTITVLGMGVTFLGLTLTSLLIVAFSLVPKLFAPRPEQPVTKPVPAGEPIPAEVLTVIATVLEVERRIYHTGQRGRLTIGRSADRSA